MSTALWIVQIILALMFGGAGAAKVMQPKEALYQRGMKYVEDFSATQIRGIGVLEVLAAIGLILPWALDIVPVLTPLAAVGLVLTMIGAMYTHIRRGENSAIVFNLVLLALAAFVAWGRFTGAA